MEKRIEVDLAEQHFTLSLSTCGTPQADDLAVK